MRLALIVLCFVFNSYAQHSAQPEQESSSDLRAGTVMFSLEEVKGEKIYWMERTPNLDYFLRMKSEDTEGIKKISSKEAKQIDMDFASRFLKMQYEIGSSETDCKVTLRLILKGDSQDVCVKDDKKTQEIQPFLNELKKRF